MCVAVFLALLTEDERENKINAERRGTQKPLNV